jgi:hypothetical protein
VGYGVLLQCTSTYPASPENTNIRTIPHLRELFGCEVGLSDHTLGLGVAVASVALGATVIEKHFTLRRAEGGVDSAFSLELVDTGEDTMTGGRLRRVASYIQNEEAFCFTYGDGVADVDITREMAFHRQHLRGHRATDSRADPCDHPNRIPLDRRDGGSLPVWFPAR